MNPRKALNEKVVIEVFLLWDFAILLSVEYGVFSLTEVYWKYVLSGPISISIKL